MRNDHEVLNTIRECLSKYLDCSPRVLVPTFRWADALDLTDQGWFLSDIDETYGGLIFNDFISDEAVERMATISALATLVCQRLDVEHRTLLRTTGRQRANEKAVLQK